MRLHHVIGQLLVIAGMFLFMGGCSSTTTIRVPVAPRVDLSQYQTIGLVIFASNEGDELRRLCTQQFLQAMQDAQSGTRVLELGTEKQVLASLDRKHWDAKALRAIQETHGVDVVVLGRFDIEKVNPDVSLSTVFKTVSLKSDVDATLSAKLVETQSGATVWSDSAKQRTTVAAASFDSLGQGHFGASDPKAVYGEMIDVLVADVTDDFRGGYITKRVPKESLQTASVETSH